MDINCLRVFNSLHSLGLTESEILNVEKEWKNDARGKCCMYVKNGYLIGVEHDIQTYTEKRSHSIYISKDDYPVPCRILLKTRVMFEPPKEVYRLHEIGSYRAMDEKAKQIANNMEELKSCFLRRFIDNYDKRVKTEEQLKAIFWLFDEEYVNLFKEDGKRGFSTIVKVFQFKNKRLAVIRKIYSDGSDDGLTIVTYTPSMPEYNYVDLGREFNQDIWISDELKGKISHEEMELMEKDEFYLLTPQAYGEIQNQLRREIMAARRREKENEGKEIAEKRAMELFKGGKVVKNGITYTKEYIEYSGVIVKGPDIDKYVYNQNILYSDNKDFNSIVEGYIESLLLRDDNGYKNDGVQFTGEANLQIGKVNLKLSGDRKNIFVWTPVRHRIRKEEVFSVLLSALTKTQEEYNQFVERVSRVSYRMLKVLENGLTFSIHPYRADDNILSYEYIDTNYAFCLRVNRVGNKNYLAFNNKQIRDIDAFFDLKEMPSDPSRWNHVERFIKLIMRAVPEITPQEVGFLIKDSIAKYSEKVEKSKLFIQKAVQLTNAREVNEGWIVKGISGVEYKVTRDLKVWALKGDEESYVCIVDIGSEEDIAGINDCIAKRLLCLSKDKMMVDEINTLKSVVGGEA